MRREELLALAPRIRAIAAAHGATNLAAHRFTEASGYGSVARDEAGPQSDLDLLVDLPARTGLLDRLALKHALEDALHCRVDLIRRRNLRPEALVEAEREAVPLG
ncbi:MAG: nucleotidyltransferase domain-containing protein [Synechococcaceae cyanobacterium]|nr:nucleotidyltransferase domain-containing protein [Synechococcaceae cyanobacterium]